MSEQATEASSNDKKTARKAAPMPKHLPPLRFKQAEFERTIYLAIPEAGTAFDDVLKPSYWAHNAAKMKPFDHIEILAEDGSWWAHLLVISTGRVEATVKVLNHQSFDVDVTGAVQEDFPGYEIRFAGPHKKHQVIRLEDSAVLKDEISTKTQARRWLQDHLKAQAH